MSYRASVGHCGAVGALDWGGATAAAAIKWPRGAVEVR
jgi:hypothetical protein